MTRRGRVPGAVIHAAPGRGTEQRRLTVVSPPADAERVRRVRRRVEERLRALARTPEGAAWLLELARVLGVPTD